MVDILEGSFEWNYHKNEENLRKHGIGFAEALGVFLDPNLVLKTDDKHSFSEQRWFCIGRIERGILTVRYTLRGSRIRIIGAGFWRRGEIEYEKKNG